MRVRIEVSCMVIVRVGYDYVVVIVSLKDWMLMVTGEIEKGVRDCLDRKSVV